MATVDIFQIVVRTDGTGTPQIRSMHDETGSDTIQVFGNAEELSAATDWRAKDGLQILAVVQKMPSDRGWIVCSADEYHDSITNQLI